VDFSGPQCRLPAHCRPQRGGFLYVQGGGGPVDLRSEPRPAQVGKISTRSTWRTSPMSRFASTNASRIGRSSANSTTWRSKPASSCTS